jgi:hypothetical protein
MSPPKPVRYANKRQVNAFVSNDVYVKATAAKLKTGRTLIQLMEEGLAMAAEKYLQQPDDH